MTADAVGTPSVYEQWFLTGEASLNACMSVVCLVTLGILATLKGVFDQKGISDLGKFVYHISLPSLLLSNIMIEVTIERLVVLWILPVFCAIQIFLAYIFAAAASCCLGLSDLEKRPAIATVMFGNVGALAIAVVNNLCDDEPFRTAFGGTAHCKQKSVSYIAFYLITQNIMMFSWGHRILVQKKVEEDVSKSGALSAAPVSPTSGRQTPLLMEEENSKDKIVINVPSIGDMPSLVAKAEEGMNKDESFVEVPGEKETRYQLTEAALQEASSRLVLEVKPWAPMHHRSQGRSLSDDEGDDEIQRHGSMRNLYKAARTSVTTRVSRWSLRRLYRGTRRRIINLSLEIRSMMNNPPIQAASIALALGLWPPMKSLFIGTSNQEAPLRSAFHAVHILGTAQVPVSMFMLSGSGTLRYLQQQKARLTGEVGKLAPGLKESSSFQFSWRAKFLMIFGRIIAMPIIGYVSWYVMNYFQLVPDDSPLITFILLIESAVPSAQNVVMLMLVHGFLDQGAAMAEVLLLQYAFSIPVFAMGVTFFSRVSLQVA
eukprot:TRINITY_DN6219_c1_g1_i1.p1 TRINITY_DN6219_c1_g1~~TRINITY_DN6219_c1_g1_i1.p1  ORF type:complete len:543 (-),score=99.75 TRINITY_DN6219_c1_g1_i1:267-1895(-)